MDSGHFSDDLSSSSQGLPPDYRLLMAEMKAQNFDVIRFSSYRTACKLRFIQKRTNLHLVDIWNIIEAFRENGLNIIEPKLDVPISRLETLISSIFFQLNKRLPSTQQIDINQSISMLLTWLLVTYDPEETGKIHVMSIKVSLATMCAGKLMDKLLYIFSLISDQNGHLVFSKFSDFIKEILALPCSVLESPSFCYSDGLASTIFDGQAKINVNDFLDTLMSDPAPQCLVWFPLFHRMGNVENVLHPVQCDGCNREAFLGFRYKCQRCYNYQLCQDCFWRGRVSGNHTNQHEMKEYTHYKSPRKQIGHSIRKSFKCVPEKQTNSIPRFPEEPENTLNLSHIVPPSPIPSHNGFPDTGNLSFDLSSLDSRSSTKSPFRSLDSFRGDDEHRLIARYAARLADSHNNVRSPSDINLTVDSGRQRDLIAQLEVKNREIMREIIRLRKQQEQEDAVMRSEQNPTLLAELRALRQRKDELESHLSSLQESRRELMVQLEALMKLLKNHQTSPRSTPNSSPRSGTSKSPPLSTPYPLSSSKSAPTTPGSCAPTTDSMTGTGNDGRLSFGQQGSTRSLRNDLLVAADSVTNAMSSLVRELNSDSDEEGAGTSKVLSSSRDFETEDTESAVESLEGGGTLWREERHRAQESKFMAEIHARNMLAAEDNENINEEEDEELYDNDPRDLDMFHHHSSMTTDDESYVRTDDDEEGGNTDWEETMRRWVNR
ncbi:dystrobrevin beta-like isoform X2 [Centruroides vittatus]